MLSVLSKFILRTYIICSWVWNNTTLNIWKAIKVTKKRVSMTQIHECNSIVIFERLKIEIELLIGAIPNIWKMVMDYVGMNDCKPLYVACLYPNPPACNIHTC